MWARSTEGFLSPCGVFSRYCILFSLQREHTERKKRAKFERETYGGGVDGGTEGLEISSAASLHFQWKDEEDVRSSQAG